MTLDKFIQQLPELISNYQNELVPSSLDAETWAKKFVYTQSNLPDSALKIQEFKKTYTLFFILDKTYKQEKIVSLRDCALGLTLLLQDYPSILSYLKQINKQVHTLHNLIYSACKSIQLPKKWNIALWKVLADKHLSNNLFARCLQFADQIEWYVEVNRSNLEAKLKIEIESEYRTHSPEEFFKFHKEIATVYKNACKNLLSPYTKVEQLVEYAALVNYKTSEKNVDAARLCFIFDASKEIFLEYLYWRNFKYNEFYGVFADEIPDVIIDGKEIGYPNYYITKIKPHDPRAAFLGRYTGCCQDIDDAGSYAVKHSLTDIRGGTFIICKKSHSKKEDLIISQSWTWKGINDGIVFDSVETHISYRTAENQQMIADFFTYLAHQLVTKHGIPRVLVGFGGKTPDLLGIDCCPFPEKIDTPHIHPDSRYQRIVADAKSPLFALLNLSKHCKQFIEMKITPNETKHFWRALYEGQYTTDKSKAIKWAKVIFYAEKGLNINLLEINDMPGLHYVIQENNFDLFTKLLKFNPFINYQDKAGNTLLHLAVSKGSIEIINKLLSKGANIFIKNAADKSPVDLAEAKECLPAKNELLKFKRSCDRFFYQTSNWPQPLKPSTTCSNGFFQNPKTGLFFNKSARPFNTFEQTAKIISYFKK